MPNTSVIRRRRRLFRLPDLNLHPARMIVIAFAGVTLVGTALLMLPIATYEQGGTRFVVALFHATSAVCVTGLNSVDTATHWTPFGQAVLLVLLQAGGLGVMSFATLLGLLVVRKIGLRARIHSATESGTEVGGVRRLLLNVFRVSLTIELLIAIALTLRWWLHYDESLGNAVWLGVFHAVSAFNNGGFALWTDSLGGFVGDAWICLPVICGVILGSLGFHVLV